MAMKTTDKASTSITRAKSIKIDLKRDGKKQGVIPQQAVQIGSIFVYF